jgi:hypothetical protein
MLFYNVTVKVTAAKAEHWLQWMKQQHIPAVMKAGGFIEYRLCRLLAEEETDPTFVIQYLCKNREQYEEYIAGHAPQLRREHEQLFGQHAVAFRTVMEII